MSKQRVKTVEWKDQDGPHKVILPADSDNVELGVPFGHPFELVFFQDVTPARVARTLREHGIWTANDLRGNVRIARAALLELSNEILTALLQSIREVDR